MVIVIIVIKDLWTGKSMSVIKTNINVFTVNQVSELLQVSPQTIVNWIEAGKLEAYKTPGGHRRIKKDDLEAFVKQHGMPVFGPPPGAEEEAKKMKKILVIDDDQVIVETITAALEEDPHGYEVITAADGFEAGIQVNHFKPDVLILDIMMPDIDGYEVCRKLKSSEETKHIKIIVLSGYLDEENYKKMREYGADLCFSKPLPLNRLKEEIAGLLYPAEGKRAAAAAHPPSSLGINPVPKRIP
jgi:excisionase family DNA binding protein